LLTFPPGYQTHRFASESRPMQEPTFAFEHAMAHRRLLGSMAPLTRFSVVPYELVPGRNIDMWHRDHQQAHGDFQAVLAGYLGGTGFGIPRKQVVPPAPAPILSQLGPAYNIEDYDLRFRAARQWWVFQNHQAHLDAEVTLSLLEALTFPFF
jgi:hypothetical protein